MRAGLAALACLLLAAAPAAAQHACPGHISATTIRPVPADARYGFALRDDNPAQVQLRDTMAAVMRRAGLTVADPPTHVMSWRGGVSGAGGGRAGTDMLMTRRDSDDLGWMRDVPRGGRAGGFGGMRLSGSVELREVASGRVVWTAVLSCDRQGSDQAALAGALAVAVVPVIGQTVSGRPF
ncbi:MAG: hypothetical protein K2X74_22915 [Acetobacteraceae bacterium]|nr:hypothetical protein [Acetobacteraceae bacterium]